MYNFFFYNFFFFIFYVIFSFSTLAKGECEEYSSRLTQLAQGINEQNKIEMNDVVVNIYNHDNIVFRISFNEGSAYLNGYCIFKGIKNVEYYDGNNKCLFCFSCNEAYLSKEDNILEVRDNIVLTKDKNEDFIVKSPSVFIDFNKKKIYSDKEVILRDKNINMHGEGFVYSFKDGEYVINDVRIEIKK